MLINTQYWCHSSQRWHFTVLSIFIRQEKKIFSLFIFLFVLTFVRFRTVVMLNKVWWHSAVNFREHLCLTSHIWPCFIRNHLKYRSFVSILSGFCSIVIGFIHAWFLSTNWHGMSLSSSANFFSDDYISTSIARFLRQYLTSIQHVVLTWFRCSGVQFELRPEVSWP